MSMTVTLIILCAALGATGAAAWLQRRPYQPGNPPLIPYGLVQFLGIVVAVVMLGHLVTLMTGQPFKGRFQP